MPQRALVVLVLATLSGACSSLRGPAGSSPAASLVGAWEQEAAPAAGSQAFVFNADSTALWIISTPARRDTFPIRYRLGSATAPATLDLFGFASGPLQGRTLYCIVDVQAPERFRMDCEPGRASADQARPRTFTGQTVGYRRRRAP